MKNYALVNFQYDGLISAIIFFHSSPVLQQVNSEHAG